jgi:hypothetical protein
MRFQDRPRPICDLSAGKRDPQHDVTSPQGRIPDQEIAVGQKNLWFYIAQLMEERKKYRYLKGQKKNELPRRKRTGYLELQGTPQAAGSRTPMDSRPYKSLSEQSYNSEVISGKIRMTRVKSL